MRSRRGITRPGKNKRKPRKKRKGLTLRAPTLGQSFRMCLFYIYFGLIVCFARNTIKQGSGPWHCGLIRFKTLSKGTKTEENIGWITPREAFMHIYIYIKKKIWQSKGELSDRKTGRLAFGGSPRRWKNKDGKQERARRENRLDGNRNWKPKAEM